MLGLEIQRLPMPFGQTPYTISKFPPVNHVCHLCGYWHRGCGRICSSSGLVEEQNHFPLKSQLNFLSLGEMRCGLAAFTVVHGNRDFSLAWVFTSYAVQKNVVNQFHFRGTYCEEQGTFTYTGWWFTSSRGFISVGFGKVD